MPCNQAGVCGARDRRTTDGGDRWSRTSATRSADSGDCVFQRCCSSEGVDGGGPGGGGGGGGGGADGGGTRADRGHEGGAADGGAADGGGPGGGGGGRGGGGCSATNGGGGGGGTRLRKRGSNVQSATSAASFAARCSATFARARSSQARFRSARDTPSVEERGSCSAGAKE